MVTLSGANSKHLNLNDGNHGEKLLNHLIDLKAVYNQVSSDICALFSTTSVSNITSIDIKESNKYKKQDIGEHVLTLLSKCHPLCVDNDFDCLTKSHNGPQFVDLIPELSKCVNDNMVKYCRKQDDQLQALHDQVSKLESLQSSLVNQLQNGPTFMYPSDDCCPDSEPAQVSNPPNIPNHVSVSNPTKCVEDYIPNFIPPDLSAKLVQFLSSCPDFDCNIENGHSVAMYGYPYHYHGSKHPGKPTDIPSPIKQVLALIDAQYPNNDINSCLVNKYCGSEAFLPKHSDNEHSIAPGSNIFTVSLGFTETVLFSELHGSANTSQTVDNNSLYIMSRSSQAYWQHRTAKDSSRDSHEVRFSLTFRHVSSKFNQSSVIIGDSNTRHLNFGTGRGTFGHLIPGERIEATHIDKIKPVDCCGYKNIFLHCGVNDIKHYRANTNEKIGAKFQQLKDIIDEIVTVCPNSRIFVSPILPTKSIHLNQRAIQFNKMLFKYRSESCRFDCLDFNAFVNEFGCLRTELGRHFNPDDQLHLGAKGVGLLVRIIRERVYSKVIISPYRLVSSVVRGGGVNGVRRGHAAAISGHYDIGVA